MQPVVAGEQLRDCSGSLIQRAHLIQANECSLVGPIGNMQVNAVCPIDDRHHRPLNHTTTRQGTRGTRRRPCTHVGSQAFYGLALLRECTTAKKTVARFVGRETPTCPPRLLAPSCPFGSIYKLKRLAVAAERNELILVKALRAGGTQGATFVQRTSKICLFPHRGKMRGRKVTYWYLPKESKPSTAQLGALLLSLANRPEQICGPSHRTTTLRHFPRGTK